VTDKLKDAMIWDKWDKATVPERSAYLAKYDLESRLSQYSWANLKQHEKWSLMLQQTYRDPALKKQSTLIFKEDTKMTTTVKEDTKVTPVVDVAPAVVTDPPASATALITVACCAPPSPEGEGLLFKLDYKEIKSCELFPNNPVIYLTQAVNAQIIAISHSWKEEWLGYLKGTVDMKNLKAIVTSIHVPEQEVSSASVDVEAKDVPGGADIIGTVHSHHTMGSFFSGTDTGSIARHHTLCLVYSYKDGIKALFRVDLPCGHFKPTEADIEVLRPEVPKTFLEKVLAKIKKKVYPTYNQGYTPGAGAAYNGYQGGWRAGSLYGSAKDVTGGFAGETDNLGRPISNPMVKCCCCQTSHSADVTTDIKGQKYCPECAIYYRYDGGYEY
jgi:hypothetical protein